VKSKFVIFALIFMAALLLVVLTARRMAMPSITEAESVQPGSRDQRVPVLVELFTSEGCSSCPPADELLNRLDQSQPVAGVEVIALSEHVDYWNRLGWADPFSSAQFSERQNDYANVFGPDEIYTPQMIVDGRVQFVGSNSSRASSAIATAARDPKAEMTVTLAKRTTSLADEVPIDIHVANLPSVSAGDTAELMLAITESGLRSNVSRGENSGRKLTHTAVVRKLAGLGSLSGSFNGETTVRIEKQWNRSSLKVVVFVQERASRRVLGATSVSLAAGEA
jgi:hypothetical protein